MARVQREGRARARAGGGLGRRLSLPPAREIDARPVHQDFPHQGRRRGAHRCHEGAANAPDGGLRPALGLKPEEPWTSPPHRDQVERGADRQRAEGAWGQRVGREPRRGGLRAPRLRPLGVRQHDGAAAAPLRGGDGRLGHAQRAGAVRARGAQRVRAHVRPRRHSPPPRQGGGGEVAPAEADSEALDHRHDDAPVVLHREGAPPRRARERHGHAPRRDADDRLRHRQPRHGRQHGQPRAQDDDGKCVPHGTGVRVKSCSARNTCSARNRC